MLSPPQASVSKGIDYKLHYSGAEELLFITLTLANLNLRV